MADIGIYTKNADIQARAGVDANTTSKATAATDIYVLNIEALINSRTRKNWSAAFTAGLDVSVAGALTDVGASMCATIVILSDIDAYPTVAHAEAMLDVLNNKINFGISFLKEISSQTHIDNAP